MVKKRVISILAAGAICMQSVPMANLVANAVEINSSSISASATTINKSAGTTSVSTSQSEYFTLESSYYTDGMCVVKTTEAFSKLTNVNVVIDSNVSEIGAEAFSDCKNIVSVNIKGNNVNIDSGAFLNCTSLSSIDWDRIKSIGTEAFYNCTSLTEVTLNNVKEVGKYVFENCTGLTKVLLNSAECIYSKYIFKNCYNINDATVRVTDDVDAFLGEMFQCDKKIGSYKLNIILDNSEKSADIDGFDNDSRLESVNFTGKGKCVIYDHAFSNCENLSEIDLSQVAAINEYAFEGTAIKNIEVMSEDCEIDSKAFTGCDYLTNVKIRVTDYTYIDEELNFNSSHSYGTYNVEFVMDNSNTQKISGFTDDSRLESVNFTGKGKVSISGFQDCPYLNKITSERGNIVKVQYALKFCPSLETVDLTGCSSIDKSAFTGCSNLSKVVLGVSSINPYDELNIETNFFKENADKAILDVTGNELAKQYCVENEISYIDNGEIVVPTTETTEPTTETEVVTTESPVEDNNWCDSNADGEVDIADAVYLNKYLVGALTLSDIGKTNSDCYKDGKLDSNDILIILNLLAMTYQKSDLPIIPE